MKYIFIPYLFNVINIHILHYKLSQISNSLTEKSQSGHSLRDEGRTLLLLTWTAMIDVLFNTMYM
jgi:hypothetical protein